LRYSHEASSGNCGEGPDAGNWQCDEIESGTSLGSYPSLGIDGDDEVLISYFDGGNLDLKVAEQVGVTTGNCGPYTGFQCTTVDASGDVGRFSALAVSGSGAERRLTVAYHEKDSSDAGSLKFAEYVGLDGNCASSTWSCWAIDETSSESSMGLDMISVDGTLAVAYFDSGNLNFAFEETGGNCGPLLPQEGGGFARSWQCGTLRSGSLNEDVGSAAALTGEALGEPFVLASRQNSLLGGRGVESVYPWILRDDFESGDSSGWSSVPP